MKGSQYAARSVRAIDVRPVGRIPAQPVVISRVSDARPSWVQRLTAHPTHQVGQSTR